MQSNVKTNFRCKNYILGNNVFGDFVIVLFSKRYSRLKKEILGILENYGFAVADNNYITGAVGCRDTVVCRSGRTDLKIGKSVVIFVDDTPFFGQSVPDEAVTVIESTNTPVLRVLLNSGSSVVNCGMLKTDTLTLSSIGDTGVMVSLQRKIKNISGVTVEPQEYFFPAQKDYLPEAVMISAAVLILYGVFPNNETLSTQY